MKNILVAIDFSEASRAGPKYANWIARKLNARISLTNVVPPLVDSGLMMGMPLLYNMDTTGAAQMNMKAWREKHFDPKVRVRQIIRTGAPFQEINRAAKELGANLIIVSTHGRTGLKHVFMGSTAERVLRHAPCPVLIVRSYPVKSLNKILQLKNILVPIDFSKTSIDALRYALPLAREFKAAIHLLHVVELPLYPELGASNFDHIARELHKRADGKIKSLKKKSFFDSHLIKEVKVCTGDSFQKIVGEAKKQKSDLLILSTHGYTGLKHVFMGSTTEKVVRHAHCPVLVTRR